MARRRILCYLICVLCAGSPKAQTGATPSWYLNMGSHSLFESGDKEAHERLQSAKPKLFLINNLYSIHMYAKDKQNRGEKPSAQDARLNVFFQSIEELLARETEAFLACILRTLVMSREDIQFSKQFENDKTNKAKMLKSMFSAFNGGVAALQQQQPEWRIAYGDLRTELDSILLSSIVSAYTEFYNANSKVNFSKKHMELYIKYTPNAIGNIFLNYFQRDK